MNRSSVYAASPDAFDLKAFVKEVGRGTKGARDLSRADAQALFGAILDERVDPLQLGGLLVAYRIKGESGEELAGLLAAIRARSVALRAPAGAAPVVLPSYNGARTLPNLVPLLARLIADAGVPVLVQGVSADPSRVTTREVLEHMDVAAAASAPQAEEQLAARRIAFLPVELLSPALAKLLELRWRLGLRGPAHTAAKMLNPFDGPALRVVPVTHPEYLRRMHEYFSSIETGGALVLRGAEGEAVAHPKRRLEMEWLRGGASQTFVLEARDAEPELPPDRDARATARWIEEALAGRRRIPAPIAFQAERCIALARSL
jgi:anthranilate phosphoribosyltransferase